MISISPLLLEISTLKKVAHIVFGFALLVWPVRSHRPECRPSSASSGHVGEVQDNQSAIVGFLAGESDTGPAVWCHIGMVYAHINGAVS
jgi:hypothetical protein